MKASPALVLALVTFCALPAFASDTVRIATWNIELFRKGPGLLLRDLRRGRDPQIAAATQVLQATRPDILALQGFDHDFDLLALRAFAQHLGAHGLAYPHLFALPSNRGVATGVDLDGDGRRAKPADAQGFGHFRGQGAMALLSRFPINAAQARDFSDLLWADVPGADLPEWPDGAPFPSAEAQAVQRLSSSGHWVVPIKTPLGQITMLTFHAAPPVFDGPEDRNGRRNQDEILFWQQFLEGRFGPPPSGPFVLAGSFILDPNDSEGRKDAIRQLLADPRLQDPRPTSPGAAAAPDQGHVTPNALDTVDWPPPGPGRLRVDYVLPSRDLTVVQSGVYWPASDPDIKRPDLKNPDA